MATKANGHAERELKFDLDGRAANRIRNHALLRGVENQTRTQRTIYFDTNCGKLRKKGYSLRVRQIGDCFTQTVKARASSAGLFEREEWEAPVRQLKPELPALDQTPIEGFQRMDELRPVARSDVKRTTWTIDRNGSAIEVALDAGTLSAGHQRKKFHELEIELKEGDADAIFELAQELSQSAPMGIGVLSKGERGRLLAQNKPEATRKAPKSKVRKGMDVGQVIALLVQDCVRQFRLNEAIILEERDAEALHYARVAIRRLRTVFAFFGPAIRRGSLAPIRQDLRRFMAPLGEARNLDIFLARYRDELTQDDVRKLTAAREDAYDRVASTLRAQRARDMFLGLVEWSVSRGWQRGDASVPIKKFAAAQLHTRWKRIARRGRNISRLEESQLHRIRIDIKKLRYSIEFMAPLFSRKKVRKFTRGLEAMQDCLGLLHDDAIGHQLIAAYSLHELPVVEERDRSRQLKIVKSKYKELKRIDRPWAR